MHPACPVGHENVMQGPQNDGRGNARRNNRQAITSVLIAQLLTVCDAMGGSSIVTRKQLKLVSPREIGALLSPYIITPYTSTVSMPNYYVAVAITIMYGRGEV